MSLRFIYGKSNSGKTAYCMNEAASLGKHAVIIVPEQYSFTAEKALADKLGIFGMGGAEVYSFGRLAQHELKTGDGAALPHIDKGGKLMLLYKIIKDNAKDLQLLSAIEGDGAEQMLSLISELKRYNITCEALEAFAVKTEAPILKMKLTEAALVCRRFEEKIKNRFVNADDNLTRLAARLEESDRLADCHIYIDGFSSFTESELAVTDVFLRRAAAVTVTLCMERGGRDRLEYLPCKTTEEKLIKTARAEGVEILPPVELPDKPPENRELAYLLDEYFNYPHKPYESEVNDIAVFEAKNPYTEVVYLASQILKLCREQNCKFRDIAIVCSDMALYSKYLKTVFAQFGIPVFPDRKIGILNHSIVVFLLSALEIITSGYLYEPVFRYAKSGFTSVDRESLDALENYVLATGIKGDVWKKTEKWDYRASVYMEREELTSAEEDLLASVNTARKQLVAPLLKLDAQLCASRRIGDKCAALYSFITDMELDKKAEALASEFDSAGDSYRAIEYRSVFNKVSDCLDAMAAAIGDDAVSNASFCEIFKSGLSQYEIGLIPALQDGVLSGDIVRIKGYDVKYLFILGAVDASFPAPLRPNGFLSDADRNLMNESGMSLAPTALDQALENDHLIYKAFSSPAEKLFVTFPAADLEGGAKRPAAVVSRLCEVFPKLEIQSDVTHTPEELALMSPYSSFEYMTELISNGKPLNESFTAAYEYFSDKPEWSAKLSKFLDSLDYRNTASPLSEKTVSSLFGNTVNTSVSRLEKFSSCPFSYFMQYTLGAKERSEMKLNYNDAGSFLHNFIDEFSQRLKQNGMRWEDATDEYIIKETDEILMSFDKRLNPYALSRSPRLAHSFVRLAETARLSLRLIREHITGGKFEPLGYEITFDENGKFKPLKITLPNGASVSLRGRIDRADVLRSEDKTCVRIIDYKSGAKDFDISDVFFGINLQLAVYMAAVCENGEMSPAGMLYFRLDDSPLAAEHGITEEDALQIRIGNSLNKINGLVVNDPVIKEAMGIPAGSRMRKPFVSADDFAVLHSHVKKTVARIASGLLSGETAISPYKSKDQTPCDYCPFKSACAFDVSVGCKYRQFPNTDCWEEMRGER